MTYDEPWKEGVNNMARPGDVANLVIERDVLLRLARTFYSDQHIQHCIAEAKGGTCNNRT